MKFTKITLVGLSTVDLPIVGALLSDIYILKDVDGLGPPEIDVSLSNTLNQGVVYQGRQPQNRELVLKVGLNPNYAIGQTSTDLRNTLYGLLSPQFSDSMSVRLMDGVTQVADVLGVVKKIEPVLFSKDPEVQITIACLSAYLSAPFVQNLTDLGKSNPVFVNTGNASVGFFMQITFTAALPSWTLTQGFSGKKISIVRDVLNDGNFLVGDRLTLDTRDGSRGIKLLRGGVESWYLKDLTTDSDWLQLQVGSNVFSTSSPSFDWVNAYFLPRYWGV